MADDTGKKQPEKKLVSGVSPDVGKPYQFKPGQSGNPAGRPKGALSLSTHIQNMLNDEEFEMWMQHPREGWVKEKGAPVKAIVKALMIKASQGDTRAFDVLAKYGYGTKVEVTGPDGAPVRALVEIVDGARRPDSKD